MNDFETIFYDFEVFIKDWLVVCIDLNTSEKTIIVNNADELESFYQLHKNDIWVGYNSRNYDQYILKGIISGIDPYFINNEIIFNDKKGYHIVSKSDEIPLNNFDISNAFRGLKELEGFMGSKIKESSIPFDIGRKLTEEELIEVIEYCTHDVEQTIEVFKYRKEEFDSQLKLIEAFNLPMTMFNKTKAQMSSLVLGAERNRRGNDEFDLIFPDTLMISEKYQYIVDWYKDKKNKDYNKKLYTDVAGVPHIFAWGGIHGAVDNYVHDGTILHCDVASLYPSIMIEYNFLSRNVTEPEKYKEIRNTRLKLKAEKNPMQAPYKIVLNATYGAMKDKHNALYDPLMANNVCVAGQLLLLDLIEKIEEHCDLIQSNTDGLFLKINDLSKIDVIKNIAKEWEKRTRLDLEWDVSNKIFQKDVNNYIIINNNGEYESKGAYVKSLSDVDNDLPIVNTALTNYFINETPLEYTIMNCNELKEFQKIVKISRLYNYALYGNEKVYEKVLRVFASTEETACGVFKVKGEDKIEKLANTPDKCVIYNETVNGVKTPEWLDKQYYLDIANKRLSDFINFKERKISKIPSDIKHVKQDVKDQVISAYEMFDGDFIDFLIYLTEHTDSNSLHVDVMTKLGYFEKFGGNKKLTQVQHEFYKGSMKYSKNQSEKSKEKKTAQLKELFSSTLNESFSIHEQMQLDIELFGEPHKIYKFPSGTTYILELDLTNAPKTKVYGLSSGKIIEIKIYRRDYKKNPFHTGDVVQFKNPIPKQASAYAGVNDEGKAIYTPIEGKQDLWANGYTVLKNI